MSGQTDRGLLIDANGKPYQCHGPIADPIMKTAGATAARVELTADKMYQMNSDGHIFIKVGGSDVVVSATDFTAVVYQYLGLSGYPYAMRMWAGFNYVSYIRIGGADLKLAITEMM